MPPPLRGVGAGGDELEVGALGRHRDTQMLSSDGGNAGNSADWTPRAPPGSADMVGGGRVDRCTARAVRAEPDPGEAGQALRGRRYGGARHQEVAGTRAARRDGC